MLCIISHNWYDEVKKFSVPTGKLGMKWIAPNLVEDVANGSSAMAVIEE